MSSGPLYETHEVKEIHAVWSVLLSTWFFLHSFLILIRNLDVACAKILKFGRDNQGVLTSSILVFQ